MTEKNNMQIIHVPMGFQNDRHKTPQFTNMNGVEWVNYGTDDKFYNAYPQYLFELYNRSANQAAIINSKSDYVFGKGFSVNAAANKDETVNDVLRKCVKDFEIFNGFALEIIWNKPATAIAEVRHLPFMKVRSNSSGTRLFYSEKWDALRKPSKNDYKEFNQFDVNKPGGTQILYVKSYDASNSCYPMPEYLGAVAYIETDIEIANFHLNNIRNQFWGGKMVVFYSGVPSEDEKSQAERDIKKKFSGSDNAGKFITVFADSKERGVEVIDITPNDLDKQFDLLAKTVQQNIFTAHRVTSPMLLGIKTEGQLGGRSELLDADELFRNTYVQHRQQFLENIFSNLYNTELTIESSHTIKQQFGENVLLQIMTKDEMREAMGLAPLMDQQPITPDAPQQSAPIQQDAVNEHLKGLSGRQTQNLMRIVRNYSSGKISKDQAMILITGGFGLSESDALSFLGIEETFKIKLSAQDKKEIASEEDRLFELFEKYGSRKEDFEIVESNAKWEDEEKIMKRYSFAVADAVSLLDKKVLAIIVKDKKSTAQMIADSLNKSVSEIEASIKNLQSNNLLTSDLAVTEVGQSVIDNAPVTVTSISIKYAYDVAPGLGAPVIKTTRDFCRKLIGLNKLFSATEISEMGAQWGYDVWNYRGGFYHNPKTNETTPYCRHIWTQVIVRENKKIN